jgi:hypothetical protein
MSRTERISVRPMIRAGGIFVRVMGMLPQLVTRTEIVPRTVMTRTEGICVGVMTRTDLIYP